MKTTNLRVVATATLLLLGCAGGGCASHHSHGVSFSKLDSFKIVNNQTTEKEVLQELGEPASTVNAQGGVKIMTWYASQTTDSTAPLGVGYEHAVTNRVLTVRTHDGVVIGHDERRSEQK
jgi:hypothetical protein